MGACSGVALEDEINNDGPDNVDYLLLRGYTRRLKGINVPDAVMDVIDSYICRARWGGTYGMSGGGPFDSLHLNGFTNKITGVES